jgi:hypothetical protein
MAFFGFSAGNMDNYFNLSAQLNGDVDCHIFDSTTTKLSPLKLTLVENTRRMDNKTLLSLLLNHVRLYCPLPCVCSLAIHTCVFGENSNDKR